MKYTISAKLTVSSNWLPLISCNQWRTTLTQRWFKFTQHIVSNNWWNYETNMKSHSKQNEKKIYSNCWVVLTAIVFNFLYYYIFHATTFVMILKNIVTDWSASMISSVHHKFFNEILIDNTEHGKVYSSTKTTPYIPLSPEK